MAATRDNSIKEVIRMLVDRMMQGTSDPSSYVSISRICGIGSNGASFFTECNVQNSRTVLKILNLSYLITRLYSLDSSCLHRSAYDHMSDIVKRLADSSFSITILCGAFPSHFETEGERKSFLREFEALKSVGENSGRVPHLVDFGSAIIRIQEPDRSSVFELPYVVMPYFEGSTLTEFVDPRHIGDVAFTLDMASQMAEIIEELRSYGIVHRDLYPNNLLYDENTRSLRLIDLGSSITDGHFHLDVPGERRGARRFMSPIQFRNPSSCSYATDAYFIGSVMFYLLSGVTPFERDRGCSTEPRKLSEVWKGGMDNDSILIGFVDSILRDDTCSMQLQDIACRLNELRTKYRV